VCAKGCDGAGACAPAPSTTVCKTTCRNQASLADQTSCTEAQCGYALATATSCNGTATGDAACNSQPVAAPCGNALVCNSATECKMSCVHDADCIADNYCNGVSCLGKLALGASCSRDGQCKSNACSPSGKCVSCNSGWDCNAHNPVCNASGTCVACTSNTDCFSGTCYQGTCVCNDNFSCTGPANPFCLPGGSGPPVCGCGTASTVKPNVVCSAPADGTGRLVKVAGQPCLSASECASGTCTNNVCAKAPNGTLCRSGADCISGHCTSTLTTNHGAYSCS
jgi:hypothetical protein